ncbi:hypothetical protein [Streptomyces sp. NPDC006739]|uniref:hypothetical protein n=1 Tax=Streptomyces sp. NPDC006739 TaxID=3364763 RepID=UPI00369D8D52
MPTTRTRADAADTTVRSVAAPRTTATRAKAALAKDEADDITTRTSTNAIRHPRDRRLPAARRATPR